MSKANDSVKDAISEIRLDTAHHRTDSSYNEDERARITRAVTRANRSLANRSETAPAVKAQIAST